jgi:hypothetical protein
VYRKRETSIGTIDEVLYRIKDANLIFTRVAKRTVYSSDEIKKMANRPVTVILFIYNFHLPRPISLKELQNNSIIETAPQSIQAVKEGQYKDIKKIGQVDRKLTIA